MSQGRKRHQITIENRTASYDATGADTGSWSAIGTYMANVVYLTGRELELARQRSATATHRVEAYWVEGVTMKSRILFGSRYLYPSAIENVGERSIEMVLLCGEEVS